MSLSVYSCVWDGFQGSVNEKLSMLAMADAANDSGALVVDLDDLSRKCRITKAQVGKIIKLLVASGWLNEEGAVYRINLTRLNGEAK